MIKDIANNKKAFFNYFVLEKYEAGIVLEGSEVKSIRENGISLAESYVKAINNELFLINAYIKPYQNSGNFAPDPRKKRKLLLKKREISQILTKISEKGLTTVCLRVYLKSNLIKVEIGVCKGKKLYDKRETLKVNSQKLEIERASKNFKF
ncbi:MAG: SsrA-binding protein SmpB [Clostridia bacterium]|nr:SsrA-binding protein SmpB [Clostridia bacterium]